MRSCPDTDLNPIFAGVKIKKKSTNALSWLALPLFSVSHMLVDLECKKTSEHKKKDICVFDYDLTMFSWNY